MATRGLGPTGWGGGAVAAASALGIPDMRMNALRNQRLEQALATESRMAPLEEELTRARIADVLAKPEERAMQRSMQFLTALRMEQTAAEARRHNREVERRNAQRDRMMDMYRNNMLDWRRQAAQDKLDEKSRAAFSKDTAELEGIEEDLDRLEVTADQLLKHRGLKGVTGIRGAIPDIPGTPAAHAGTLLNTLKSQVMVSTLLKLRRQSKTGGALGNISNLEGEKLSQYIAALERANSYADMQAELRKIVNFAKGSKSNLRGQYQRSWGNILGRGAVVPGIGAGDDVDEQIREYERRLGLEPGQELPQE